MEDDLVKLYRFIPWPMRPSEESAVKRFERLREFFTMLVDGYLKRKDRMKILDIAAGSGIAGVALAKALENAGSETTLIVTDIRKDDLGLSKEWSKLADFRGKVEQMVLDARDVNKLEEKFDIAMLWGLSTPHFSPKGLTTFVKKAREILSEDGTLIIEETDRIYGIFYRSGYKEFLRESENTITIHSGYDEKSGMFLRDLYKLPGFEKVAPMKVRMWDTPMTAAICEIFFENVKILWAKEHGKEGICDVILASATL